MNRWCYFEGALDPAEKIHGQCTGCRLYDGDVKTNYKDGTISISSHKITFHGEKVTLFIPMRLIISANCVAGSWNHSPKVELFAQQWEQSLKPPGPQSTSRSNEVRFAVAKKGQEEFAVQLIQRALEERVWEKQARNPAIPGILAASGKSRGIGAVVKSQEAKHEKENQMTSEGLQDLKKLMKHADDLAKLAQTAATKVDGQDEVAKLRSMMMSLGLQNEDRDLQLGLEKELAVVCRPLLEKSGGMMVMEEVYCALNRARGSELVSPEEVYSAAKVISKTYPAAGLVFKKYDSGIAVLQDSSLSDTAVVDRLLALISEFPDGLSTENYSAKAGFSPVVAKEHLHMAEQKGEICRDDSSRGVKFFPNLFQLHSC
ncbi:unnamed protein product [Oikopleura dioica]|uniref:Vacuolar protein-sorting-associated protein 36 n=2 Tax=Oikopleura dioica TaxID=34765 RepID=E4YAU8_OIKDI|nr:unnamed protein product [Oikopleura dioica]